MLKAAAGVLLVGLLVLLVMSLLIVTNLDDQVAALRAELDAHHGSPSPPPGAQATFDVETAPIATGDSGTLAQLVALDSGPPPRFAVIALVEVIGPDGTRTPVASNPVVLVPEVTAEIPVGPGTGCLIPAGGPLGAWVVSLEGNAVRIAPRGCYYARPIKGRLRGLVSR